MTKTALELLKEFAYSCNRNTGNAPCFDKEWSPFIFQLSEEGRDSIDEDIFRNIFKNPNNINNGAWSDERIDDYFNAMIHDLNLIHKYKDYIKHK